MEERRAERDTELIVLVDGRDQAPEHQLHIDRGAAEDPQVHPRHRFEHRVGRQPHHREEHAERDRRAPSSRRSAAGC